MKVLYVYAHPEPKSFNGALKETALAALQEKGHGNCFSCNPQL